MGYDLPKWLGWLIAAIGIAILATAGLLLR